MRYLLTSLCAGFAVFLSGCEAGSTSEKTSVATEAMDTSHLDKEVAVISTSEGDITIAFRSDKAPHTVENFKKLAHEGYYDGTCFHRVIKGFMAQGGDPKTKNPALAREWGTGGPGYSIKAEFNDLHHGRGVISMARSADPDSAGSQFFLCDDNAGFLDGKYTAFGQVIKGDDVLAKLLDSPVAISPSGEKSAPVHPVCIKSVNFFPLEDAK